MSVRILNENIIIIITIILIRLKHS